MIALVHMYILPLQGMMDSNIWFHTLFHSEVNYTCREIGGQRDYAVFGHCVILCP